MTLSETMQHALCGRGENKRDREDSWVLLSKTLVRLVLFHRWDNGGVKLKESRRGKKRMEGLSDRYDADLHYYEQQIRLYPFLKDRDRTNWTAKRVTCILPWWCFFFATKRV